MFIIGVSALRAATEDKSKHNADAVRNGHAYNVVRPQGLVPTASGELRVGDIVQVRKDEMVPADMLFLGSSLAKGHCFIDKANLNGETTLEVLQCLKEIKAKGLEDFQKLQLELVYEDANKRFDAFRGTLRVGSSDGRGHSEDIHVDGKSLVMSETNLRNNDFIYGLVVYSGVDTKIQMSNNAGGRAKIKQSRIMRVVDWLLRVMFLLQTSLCILNGALAAAWVETHEDYWPLGFEGDEESIFSSFVLRFCTWFILLSQMVPISLIVTAEMVKFAMSILIQWDVELYEPTINKAAKCNSSTIHEDLGLVSYIFRCARHSPTRTRQII